MTQERITRARARALAAAADVLAQESEKLSRAADVQEQVADHESRMATLPKALRAMRLYMDKGLTESEALARAADVHELPPDTIAARWRDSLTRDRSGRLWRRNREVMRLARDGKSNAEIARLVKLAPGSVSRIIRAKIRAGALLGLMAQENYSPRSLQIDETGRGGVSIPPRPAIAAEQRHESD